MKRKKVSFGVDVYDPPPTLKCSRCPYREFKAFALALDRCKGTCQKLYCGNCIYTDGYCKSCYVNKPVIINGTQIIFSCDTIFEN